MRSADRIVTAIREFGPMTPKELSQGLHLCRNRVYVLLEELGAKDVLKRTRYRGRTGRPAWSYTLNA